jgi:hypothetical protein
MRSACYAPPIAAEQVGTCTAAAEAHWRFALHVRLLRLRTPLMNEGLSRSDEAPKASSSSEKLDLDAE